MTVSPFTLQQQVLQGHGQSWYISFTFPPIIDDDDARACSAFHTKLHGQVGTYKYQILPRYLDYTVATGSMGLRSINNDFRDNITIDCAGGSLGEGTFIQIGTQLLQVTSITHSGSTHYNCDIFPHLRQAYPSGSVIDYTTPEGIFRQRADTSGQTFNPDHTDTFELDGMEAIA